MIKTTLIFALLFASSFYSTNGLEMRRLFKRQAVSGAPCSSSSDLTPATTDCSKFQRCANGITYIFSCGPGTVFNPSLKVCDYPYNVPQPCTVGGSSSGSSGSSSGCTTSSSGVVTGSPAGSSCSSSADLTPWSSDCSQFQRCANGITYVFSCGPGTVFNPNLRVCDYPYNVPQPCTVGGSSSGCAAASTAAPTAATTAASGSGGSAVSGAPCTSANDLTPATTDCSKFQRCANGITYIFSCGPGTVFNPNLRVCDYPYNVPQPCTVSGGSAASTSAPTAASTAAPTSASTTAATVPASTTSNTYPNCFLSLTSTDRATYCADPTFVSSFPGCCP